MTHWIVNTNLKREGGYQALIEQLDKQNIPYTLVRKPPFVDYLISMEDDLDHEGHHKPIRLDITGPVFVTGTTSMKEVARNHGWLPGYFDAPSLAENIEHWGKYCLNHDATFGNLGTIIPPQGSFFIRPNLDSKSFAGTIMDDREFSDWRNDLMSISGYTTLPASTEVIIAPLQTIWAEYRCIIADGKYLTGSRYKTGRTVGYSPDVGQRIIDFANERVREWNPRLIFTLDVADTPDGLRIIETNAVSSSGFYAIDMNLFVGGITQLIDDVY